MILRKNIIGKGKDNFGMYNLKGHLYYCNGDIKNGFKYFNVIKTYEEFKKKANINQEEKQIEKKDKQDKQVKEEYMSKIDMLIKITESDREKYSVKINQKKRKKEFPEIKNDFKKKRINEPTNGSIIGVYDAPTDQFWTWMILQKFKLNNYKMICLYPIGYGHENWCGHIQNIKLNNFCGNILGYKNKLLDNDWVYEKHINGRLNRKEVNTVIKRINERRKGDYIVKILNDLFPEKVIGLKK